VPANIIFTLFLLLSKAPNTGVFLQIAFLHSHSVYGISGNAGKRIIPCLDVRDGRVVKGINFEGLRDAGSILEQARFYNNELADELVFLDISASLESRKHP